MTTSDLPPADDPELEANDTLLPGAPGRFDTAVTAGVALFAERLSTGALARPGQGPDASDTDEQEPDADS